MGRAGAMADWDPLLIGQLLGDHRVFDNRGMATTSNPSPEPVTVPLMGRTGSRWPMRCYHEVRSDGLLDGR
jgi:hypothetical protein